MKHGGFGSEDYAREELRAEIAAMMTGEHLGVGHEPRHGTAYVSSWIKALENDPKEIRAAAVDAQRMSDWLMARERERSMGDDKAEREGPNEGLSREPGSRESKSRAVAGTDERSPVDDGGGRHAAEHPQQANTATAGEVHREMGPSR